MGPAQQPGVFVQPVIGPAVRGEIMAKLGLFLILVGGSIGPLLSARAIRIAMLGIEAGQGELAVAGGINQVFAALAAGVTVGLSGFMIVMISRYRGRDRVEGGSA